MCSARKPRIRKSHRARVEARTLQWIVGMEAKHGIPAFVPSRLRQFSPIPLKKDIDSSDNDGGLRGLPTLRPGESRTEKVNLLYWGTFSRPGNYEVHCRYKLELEIPRPDRFDATDYLAHAHECWDDAVEQVIEILVLE